MILTLTPEEVMQLVGILALAEDEARCGGYQSHTAIMQLLAKVQEQAREQI